MVIHRLHASDRHGTIKRRTVAHTLETKEVVRAVSVEEVVYDEKPVEVDYDVAPVAVNVSDVPTLEEAVADYQCGCTEAFDYIYRYYASKFDYNASRYNDEDVKQELGLVLYRCARKYRSGGSSSFNTFFWTCAQNHLGMYVNKKRSKKRFSAQGVISLNTLAFSDATEDLTASIPDKKAEDPFDDVLLKSMLETRIYTQLTPRDEYIVRQLTEGFSVAAISEKLGVTPPGVYVRIKKLRKRPDMADRLKELHELLSERTA